MGEPPQKRFKFTSTKERINSISVDTGRFNSLSWQDGDTDDVERTPFIEELDRLALLDLTIGFQELYRDLSSLTTSLAITLHHITPISERFHTFYTSLADNKEHTHSGLDSALQLHRAFFETCLGEAVWLVPTAAKDLLHIGSMSGLDPKLIERAFSVLSLILRIIAPSLSKADDASKESLRSTWTEVRLYLSPGNNKAYVRRCVADAWVGLVRKSRADSLQRLVSLMLEDQAYIQGTEAIWAHGLKGPGEQLHSRAIGIVELLLQHLTLNPIFEESEMLGKVLIAMVHHCSPSTLTPIADAVVKRIGLSASVNPDKVTSLLNLLSCMLFTRKGKRFPEMLLKQTMQKLIEMMSLLATSPDPSQTPSDSDTTMPSAPWRQAISQAVIGCLIAGRLAQWLSPGVALIERFWDAAATEERFAFVNALIKLRWVGLEQFVIPHVARTILPALSVEPLPTLTLLNHLAESGHLEGSLSNVQGGRWRQTFIECLQTLFQSTFSSEPLDLRRRRVIGQLLHLLPTLTSEASQFSPFVISFIERIMTQVSGHSAHDLRERWAQSGPWNDSHLMALSLQAAESFCVVQDVEKEMKVRLLENGILSRALSLWHLNREVMSHVASFFDRWQIHLTGPSLDLDSFSLNLMSADASLRSSTLRILESSARSTSDSPPMTSTSEIWAQCLEVEKAGMSLKNVRERTTQIARLGRLLTTVTGDNNELEKVISMAIRFLVAQLKINFRPIYTETITVLSSFGRKQGSELWTVIWSELEKTFAAETATILDFSSSRPIWGTQQSSRVVEKSSGVDEAEKEFSCHAFERSQSAIAEAWSISYDVEALDAMDVTPQIQSGHLDVFSYEEQLLEVLSSIPVLAEQHTRLLIPMLFAVAGQADADAEDEALKSVIRLNTRQRQTRLAHWLDLLAKFVNPKAAFRTEELHTLYLRILSKGDSKLQEQALSCLMTYKSPRLVPYEDNLRRLLDDTKFRDELSSFDFATDGNSVSLQDREVFIPIAIRLLYGIVTSRRGRNSSAHSLVAAKRAALTALSGCSSEELSTLIDLMLENFGEEYLSLGHPVAVWGRQQLGFLSLLSDVIRYLGSQTVLHWPRLIRAVIRLVDNAQRQISVENDINGQLAEDDEDVGPEKGTAPLRKVRSLGIKRLVQFLNSPVPFDFGPFLGDVFNAAIVPRLDKLEQENSQAPSGTLDLIAALATSTDTVSSLIDLNSETLPRAFSCLTAIKVKSAVIARIFDIIDSLLAGSEVSGSESTTYQQIIAKTIDPMIDNLIKYVEIKAHPTNDELRKRLMTILSRLSTFVHDGIDAQRLAALLCPMLRQSSKRQPESTNVNILDTLKRLLSISPGFSDPSSSFFKQSYDVLVNLLQSVQVPATRRALVATLQVFTESDPSLIPILAIVSDLNAYSVRRLEEPDFDKRLSAFAQMNDCHLDNLPKTMRDWLPILRSALYFIKDPEELSIRMNASTTLKRFIDVVERDGDEQLVNGLSHVVIPGLRQTLRSKIELVRNEVLSVIAHGAKSCHGIAAFSDLQSLLGDDDDANFFVNITHIQVHRRARALRRLRDTVSVHQFLEANIVNVFSPVLEHIIAGATEVTDHHLVNEAITTLGALGGKLRWSRYNTLLWRHIRLGSVKTNQQKLHIRAVSAIIDHFHFDLDASEIQNPPAEDMPPVNDELGTDSDDEGEMVPADIGQTDEAAKITDTVLNRLLPTLSKLVSRKDETEDTIRIPLALVTVKLAKALPSDTSSNEILRVTSIVCQILRSKDQDTRDIARETLGKIAVYLGPEWLSAVLKELQSALQRGPQKHVAAVVTHSILSLATNEAPERFSDLDDAVGDAIRLSAEVVWGESGKDAVAEGYRTKMREVRGAPSRGHDTFQLLSRLVSPAKIAIILAPIRDIMHTSQAVKSMQQVEEALRRVALGLNNNLRIGPKDILTLCHSLVSGNSSYLKPKRKAPQSTIAREAYRVQLKRDIKEESDFYLLNAHRFVTFGLELFVTAYRRGRFDFEDVQILGMLDPMVNAIGSTLYSSSSSVILLGLKASAAIARCPLPQVEPALPLFIANIFKIIKNAGGSAESEVAQTALKTLAVILRECQDSKITDTQLKYLLEVISPDMEDNDRQAAVFTILRALVSRQFVVPEVYDLMERVSSIIVTSQSTHVQELSRGVLMQFLLDYPQGKGRLKSQMAFLARNLDYAFESGRVSVMEVLSAIFTKFSDELIEEYADLFFVALVAVIANDDAEKCRAMAGALIQQLLGRLSPSHRKKAISILTSWVNAREEQATLAGASLAVLGLLADLPTMEKEFFGEMELVIIPVIEESAALLTIAENSDHAFDSSDLDYALPHRALSALSKCCKTHPQKSDSTPVPAISAHLLFPHDWVRLAAARVLLTLFGETTPRLSERDTLDIARKSCIILQGSKTLDGHVSSADSTLADQIVKLLWNIAKIWAGDSNDDAPAIAEDVDDNEDEVQEEDNEGDTENETQSLPWLMSRMSFIARHIIIHHPSSNSGNTSNSHWISPLMSILRFFAGMFEHLDSVRARHFILHVLSPVHRILDEGSIPESEDAQIDALRELAIEVRDFVQTKVGATEFSRVWESIRQKTASKREERRDTKNRMIVADPKSWADRKSKRGVMKKESKKRKVKAFADNRGRARKASGRH